MPRLIVSGSCDRKRAYNRDEIHVLVLQNRSLHISWEQQLRTHGSSLTSLCNNVGTRSIVQWKVTLSVLKWGLQPRSLWRICRIFLS